MDTIFLDNGQTIKMDLSPEQRNWIEQGLKEGVQVPFYATTVAKRKYGDCIIGNVINLNYKRTYGK